MKFTVMTGTLVVLTLFNLTQPVRGDDEMTAQAVVAGAAQAADAFLATLSDAQSQKVLYDFTDEKQRHNWSNLPTAMVPRGGVRWGDLNQPQKNALQTLLKATLSENAWQQITDNMGGDEVLKIQSPRGGLSMFGRDEYYVSLLGKPSTTKPWMLQFGGHHLAINVTMYGPLMTISPSLTGGQPVDYTLDGRTVRQLAAEEDKAFEFITSLTSEQRQQAVLARRYTDMIYGPGKEGATPKSEGLNAGSLSDEQRQLLLQLIGERLSLMKPVFAKSRMERIRKDLSDTWFAWYGDTDKGSASTFRIQGPTILMEYAPQRLGGDPTNHTHAMYRDPTNDYGLGMLKQSR